MALGRLGLVDAIPAIRSALAGELDGRTKRRMNEAIRDLEDGARPAEEARRLHDEVQRLRGETAKLRERMDRLETRLGPPPAAEPTARQDQSAPAPSPAAARAASRPVRTIRPGRPPLQLGDDVAGIWRARASFAARDARWRRRPGGRRRRSARRSC